MKVEIFERDISEIVDFENIGSKALVHPDRLLQEASLERMFPASADQKKTLLLAIDIQNDFMENGSLPVKGSHKDVENLIRFIYSNSSGLTKIIASMDTHTYYQIFHPSWWKNQSGQNPQPFTQISSKDIKDGVWTPVKYEKHSKQYVEYLESTSKKSLVIWPYHCLLGTFGNSLEGQFANMAYYHSAIRETDFEIAVKGTSPFSEMYGIFKPEFSEDENAGSVFLKRLAEFDKILIAGQAKSHCVLESISQIVNHYKGCNDLTQSIYLLEDCTSCIEGFEEATDETLSMYERDYGIKRVRSTEIKL